MLTVRRILTALALVVGSLAIWSAPPASADTVSGTTTWAICTYGPPGGPPSAFWDLWDYHTLHYGSAHVTQCAYRQWTGESFQCWQYVWNIPNPYWDNYLGPGGLPTPCW